MKVRLSLYASLGDFLPDEEGGSPLTVEVASGATIGDLLDQVKVPAEVPKFVFLNGVHAKRDTPLKDGDEVGAFPPVAGGRMDSLSEFERKNP